MAPRTRSQAAAARLLNDTATTVRQPVKQATVPKPSRVAIIGVPSDVHTLSWEKYYARKTNMEEKAEDMQRQPDRWNKLPEPSCLDFMLDIVQSSERRMTTDDLKTVWEVIPKQRIDDFWKSARGVKEDIVVEYRRWRHPSGLSTDPGPSLVATRWAEEHNQTHVSDAPTTFGLVTDNRSGGIAPSGKGVTPKPAKRNARASSASVFNCVQRAVLNDGKTKANRMSSTGQLGRAAVGKRTARKSDLASNSSKAKTTTKKRSRK